MLAVRTRIATRFARQAGEIYVFQGVSLAAALVGSVIVARTLGPAGKGTLDLFFILTTLVVEFGMLGIGSGFLYQLANQRRPLAEIHGDVIAVAFGLGTVGISAAVLFPVVAGELVGGLNPAYAALALGMTGLLVYGSAWASVVIGTDRAPLVYRVQGVFALINLLFILALWRGGQLTVESMLVLTVGSVIALTIVQFMLLKGYHRGERLHPRKESIEASFRYGLRSFPGSVANWLHFRVDQVIIAHFLGTTGVGIYALGVRWAEMLWLVGYGLLNAGLYRIASSPDEDSRTFTWKLFKVVLTSTAAAGIVLAVVASPLINMLYGADFSAAVAPLILLVPGVVAWDAARVLSNYISLNRGRPQVPTVIAIAGSVLNIVGTIAAVPVFGIVGAAAVSSVTYVGVMLVTILVFLRIDRRVL